MAQREHFGGKVVPKGSPKGLQNVQKTPNLRGARTVVLYLTLVQHSISQNQSFVTLLKAQIPAAADSD